MLGQFIPEKDGGMSTKHLLLIEANGLAYRAFYSRAPMFRPSDKMPIHAVTGFTEMVWKMLGRADADPYDYAAVVFDPGGKTFRHDIYPDYKAGRVKAPALAGQLPLLREAARCLGLSPVEMPGFEADDVIATLATMAKAQGVRTTIVSVDKDFCQLVEDDVIEIVNPVTRTRIRSADVEAKFGVPPKLMPALQALSGDASDNIPGVHKIGRVTAAALLHRHGDLDGVLRAAQEPGRSSSQWREIRKCGHETVSLWLRLARLRADIELPIDLPDLVPSPVTESHLRDLLAVLEVEHLYDTIFGGAYRTTRYVEPSLDDHYAWWRTERLMPSLKQPIPATPQCGFYRRRLVQGGAFVGVKIWRDADTEGRGQDKLRCLVDGKVADPVAHWSYCCSGAISEAAYQQMIDEAAWARDYSPDEAIATPTVKIDWNKEPL